jgi:hypothetical protein
MCPRIEGGRLPCGSASNVAGKGADFGGTFKKHDRVLKTRPNPGFGLFSSATLIGTVFGAELFFYNKIYNVYIQIKNVARPFPNIAHVPEFEPTYTSPYRPACMWRVYLPFFSVTEWWEKVLGHCD